MLSRIARILAVGLLVLVLIAQPVSVLTAQAGANAQVKGFVKQAGPQLRLNGKIFRFGGTNNYYLMYKSQAMVDDVLSKAADSRFTVLRTWGSLDIGYQDGSNSINGKSDGVYFQYFDPQTGKPAYNDGADGLERLDYVIFKAGHKGIRLVIPFTNNWNNFGGMDQYVRWANGQYHDQFYTDPTIRQWYKDWIAHLLNRVNTYTGIKYKDDPTIMTWELANEPRCLSAGAYPRSANCTTQTLIDWADEMSTFIKTIDHKHLVSVGDEGFYCIQGATDWTENCGEGVDTIAFTQLENIDVMSFHLYPDHWGKDAAWGTEWIARHFADARSLDKPAMLGEFGLLDKNTRNVVYKTWTDTVFQSGGSGALYWILSGIQDDGSLYPDYDGFTVYCESPVCITLSNFAQMMLANRKMTFLPVADNDLVTTEYNTSAVLTPLANDITYGKTALKTASFDIDPAVDGVQSTVSVAGGTFDIQPDTSVRFTPTEGFAGKSTASYTIADTQGRISNIAEIIVTVKPNPLGAQLLYSFETGVESWGWANWQDPTSTSFEQSADWASDGARSLKLTQPGGWIQVNLNPPLDLSTKTQLKYDIHTLDAGSSTAVALQLGSSYQWCQSSFIWTGANTTETRAIDLNALGCSGYSLNDVRSILIYFNAGTFYLDNVLVQ